MKKLLLTMAVGILVLATMALSFADAAFSPADIFAKLKGITTEEAYDLRLETGKSFGTLAEEAGFYDAFKAATLDAKKAILDDLVAKGELTQEEADEIYANLEACDGTQQHMYRGIFGNPEGRSGEARRKLNRKIASAEEIIKERHSFQALSGTKGGSVSWGPRRHICLQGAFGVAKKHGPRLTPRVGL